MANAATKVRNAFLTTKKDMTLTEIKRFVGDLKANEISMALSYLKKQRYVTRVEIPNPNQKQRKNVWLYKYFTTPIPK